MNEIEEPQQTRYGEGDATFQAAGGEQGIRKLVSCFYDNMDTIAEAKIIRAMHPEDMAVSRDKLARFLCGWTGGPKLFSEKYGPIKIPVAHRHLDIGTAERDAWLLCMKQALAAQDYPQSLRDYLIKELAVPAERSRTRD